MWLLFLNSLKGLKAKKVQMIGLICLILISTGIYTTMNSALDRMDTMANQYMKDQNVEHMTVILNETKILTRENIADMFNEQLNEWKDISLTPVEVTDEDLEAYDAETLDEMRTAIAALGVPPFMVDTILKQQIGKSLAGVNYLTGILDGTNPVNDVNTYLFYGCSASAVDDATNRDPTLPYVTFCPMNPSGQATEEGDEQESETPEDECAETTGSNAATYIMKLYNNFSAMTNTSKYGVDKYQYLDIEMQKLAEQYDFSYLLKASKAFTFEKEGDEQNYAASVMIYEPDLIINSPYLLEGRWPSALNEITVSPQFASFNNIVLNSVYNMGEHDYHVIGFAYAPDYIYPAVSFNTPVYDEKRQTVVFTTPETYDNFEGKVDKYYTAKFNNYAGLHTDDELQDLVNQVSKSEYVTFVLSTATIHPRISTFTMAIQSTRTFTSYFLYVLLAIAVFIILMVMKKRIEDERLQIGVLKSLGYSTPMIAAGYLVYPIVGSIVGGLLGYGLGALLQNTVVTLYKAFYNIPVNDFMFDPKYLILSVAIPLLVLSISSYLVALFMLRQRPLKLLREGSNLKVNVLTKAITKITKPLNFKSRFKLSLASRSLGKLFVITLCSFCTGLLLVLTLIGSTMMDEMVEKTFAGASYKYQVSYSTVIDPTLIEGYNEDHTGEDLIMKTELTLYQVIHKNGDVEVLDESRAIEVNGVGENLSLLKITDYNTKDITAHLYADNGQGEGIDNIIINDTIKTLLKIDVGDTLVVSKRVDIDGNVQCANDKKYYVVDINGTFSGLSSYVTKESLNNYLDYDESAYNLIYTNENKDIYSESNELISSVFRFEDLKQNVALAIQMANYSIYIIVLFSGAMALVIISVVSNVVVEENKKHISLMKVMGYTENEIKKVVLNIYTPFVFVAYWLSIPAMKGILRFIISLVVKDLDFSVPINLSWQGALLGLAVIMTAYFIALQLSRKALNRVALAEALKRE